MSSKPPGRIRRIITKVVRRLIYWAPETWLAARAVRHERGLSTLGVLAEQLKLYRNHDLDQYAYYWYRLFEREIPYQAKTQYLPDSRRANRRLWKLLTPECYRRLYDNKLLFNHFFRAVGLPLAQIYAVYDPQVGFTGGGAPLRSPEQLDQWLRAHGAAGFVFKPVEGIQGHSILVFAGREGDSMVTLAGDRYDTEALVRFAGNTAELLRHNPGANPTPFLLEERLLPHPVLADFVGPTLCSVRVQTLIARDGAPQIFAAVFKLQPGTAGIDHLLYGAVGCWVDLDTGRLGRGRSRGSRADTTVIPGTDRHFTGFQLPEWDAIRHLALKAAAAFPWARSIGWDIGVCDRGPVLIEGNERWSPSLVQMPAPRGLMTGEFEAVCRSLRASPSERP